MLIHRQTTKVGSRLTLFPSSPMLALYSVRSSLTTGTKKEEPHQRGMIGSSRFKGGVILCDIFKHRSRWCATKLHPLSQFSKSLSASRQAETQTNSDNQNNTPKHNVKHKWIGFTNVSHSNFTLYKYLINRYITKYRGLLAVKRWSVRVRYAPLF